jgi:uronate dehydrogenase
VDKQNDGAAGGKIMKVLITGAAGRIGTKLRHEFRGQFDRLVLLDRLTLTDLHDHEVAYCGEMTDKEVLLQALDGVDAVVHLASIPHEASMEDILHNNIMGTWSLYELAHQSNVKRIVHGSSNHVVGFYPRHQIIDATALPRPDTRYGLSKGFGEMLGQYFADKHGLKSLHIRIGNAANKPEHARSLSLWVSGRDLAQLVMIGITHPDIENTVVYGISRNSQSFYDNSVAERLGYCPQDTADDYEAEIEAARLESSNSGREPSADHPVGRYFQGGHFCTIDYNNQPMLEAIIKTQL